MACKYLQFFSKHDTGLRIWLHFSQHRQTAPATISERLLGGLCALCHKLAQVIYIIALVAMKLMGKERGTERSP